MRFDENVLKVLITEGMNQTTFNKNNNDHLYQIMIIGK